MQKLKKFLLLALLVLCFVQPVLAQDDSSELAQLQALAETLNQKSLNFKPEQPILSLNLDTELQNASDLNSSSALSNLESASVSELFDNLEQMLTQQDLRIKTLSLSLEKSESVLMQLQQDVNSSRAACKQLKEALVSNKDDTSYMIGELGKLLDEIQKRNEYIDYLVKKEKGAYVYGNIVTAIPGILLMTYGILEMNQGNSEYGMNFVKIGAVTLVGMELTYQCGHWVFRWW